MEDKIEKSIKTLKDVCKSYKPGNPNWADNTDGWKFDPRDFIEECHVDMKTKKNKDFNEVTITVENNGFIVRAKGAEGQWVFKSLEDVMKWMGEKLIQTGDEREFLNKL